MKTKHFYAATLGRKNMLKTLILVFFFSITSYFRLALEVFVRKRFGVSYFNLGSAITVFAILLFIPYLHMRTWYTFEVTEFIKQFVTWYAFAFAFAYKCCLRYRENHLAPGEFDFSKHSQYGGDHDYRFYQINFFGNEPTSRQVATLLEPALFLGIGIALIIMGQPIGYVITVCSILYSLGYFGAFHLGDTYVQEEIIDKMIMAEELKETSLSGRYPDRDKGFELFELPNNPEFRRRMAQFLTNDDEPLQAY